MRPFCDTWAILQLIFCRPLFRKSERFLPPSANEEKFSLYFNPENHGTTGPISSVYSEEFGDSHQYWHSTLHKLGIKTNKNHFGGSNVGCWTSLTSVDPETRQRCYSATGYFQPANTRPNLSVLTEAFVEEITIERVGGELTATGARFSQGGHEWCVKASKEVIICCGSVQSPQLLEISGIGNPEVLNAARIDVKVPNCNVGENLQEHMSKSKLLVQ